MSWLVLGFSFWDLACIDTPSPNSLGVVVLVALVVVVAVLDACMIIEI